MKAAPPKVLKRSITQRMKVESKDHTHITRRKLLRGAFAWIFGAGLVIPAFLRGEASAKFAGSGTSRRKTLVVFFTRFGNTRVIAEQLHRDLPADLFEIQPATPSPR